MRKLLLKLVLVLAKIVFENGVYGSVVARMMVPLAPTQVATHPRPHHPIRSHAPIAFDLAEVLLNKHLSDMESLKNHFRKHLRHNKPHEPKPHHQKEPLILVHSKQIYLIDDEGSSRGERERKNGDIILVPLRQKGSELPLYVRREPQPYHKKPSTEVPVQGTKTNVESQFKGFKDNIKSKSKPTKGVFTGQYDTSSSTSSVSSESHEEDAKQKNLSRHKPLIFHMHTNKPLFKHKFSDKFHAMASLLGKNASEHQKWISPRPQTIRPYEVEENVEENIRAKETNPVTNKRLPQRQIPSRPTANHQAQQQPQPDDSYSLLHSTLIQILKGIMGYDQYEQDSGIQGMTASNSPKTLTSHHHHNHQLSPSHHGRINDTHSFSHIQHPSLISGKENFQQSRTNVGNEGFSTYKTSIDSTSFPHANAAL